MTQKLLVAAWAALLSFTTAGIAQGPPGGGRGGPPGPGVVKPIAGERIVWFGTLDSARAEAKRTNRPILLLAAAPHCHNVSGVW